MGYNIDETYLAGQDLEHIVEYIANSLANPAAASAFLDAVYKCYNELEQMPHMYGLCNDAKLREKGFHKAVIKHYVMVYSIDEEHNKVHILRFFYGRREYETLI